MKRLFSFLLLLALMIGLVWIIGFLWFIGQVPRQDLSSVNKNTAQVGVVLTGAQGRIMHGLILLYEKRITQLYITGVNENVPDNELISALGNEQGEKLYNQFKSNITIDRNARSTRGNALETQEYLKDYPEINRLMLITSNYHLPRSMHEFKRVFPDFTLLAEPVFSPQFHVDWWTNKESAILMASEYHKFLISFVVKHVAQETQISEFIANNPI